MGLDTGYSRADGRIALGLLATVCVYLAFEFAFNATLLDFASSLSAEGGDIRAIERFGRAVAGTGFALLAASLMAKRGWQMSRRREIVGFGVLSMICVAPFALAEPEVAKFVAAPLAGVVAFAVALSVAPEKRLARGAVALSAVLLVAWPGMFFGQKILFERYVVEASSPEQRQAARYVNFLKSGLREGAVELENAPFDAARMDGAEERTFLVLLGGLAWIEPDVAEFVRERKDEIADRVADRMVERRLDGLYADYKAKRQQFIEEAWRPYKRATADYREARDGARQTASEKWSDVESKVETAWESYRERDRRYDRRIADGAERLSPHLLRYVERFTNCDGGRCQRRVRQDFAESRVNGKIAERIGRRTDLVGDWCWERDPDVQERVADIEGKINQALSNPLGTLAQGFSEREYLNCVGNRPSVEGRLAVLAADKFEERSGGYRPDLNRTAFKVHPETSRRVRAELAEEGLDMPENWRVTDRSTFVVKAARAVRERARDRWTSDARGRFGGDVPPGLPFSRFVEHPAVESSVRERAGADWSPGFSFAISTKSGYLERVVRPRIERRIEREARLLEARVERFADGGDMAEEGREAVRAAIIPPISLALSLFFAIASLAKTGVGALGAWASKAAPPRRAKAAMAGLYALAAAAVLVPPFVVENKFSESGTFGFFADEFAAEEPVAAALGEYAIRIQPVAYPLGRAAADLVGAEAIVDALDWTASASEPEVRNVDARIRRIAADASREQLREMQRELAADGHYDGAIDGLYGPKTHRAMASAHREGDSTSLMRENGL